MNLRELRAQHPDLYEEAVAVGVRQERDRVGAHLTLGEQSGALEAAFTAIREGTEMTQTMQATYMAAAMNRADNATRQAETDAAGATLDNTPEASDDDVDLGAKVADLIEARRGKKKAS